MARRRENKTVLHGSYDPSFDGCPNTAYGENICIAEATNAQRARISWNGTSDNRLRTIRSHGGIAQRTTRWWLTTIIDVGRRRRTGRTRKESSISIASLVARTVKEIRAIAAGPNIEYVLGFIDGDDLELHKTIIQLFFENTKIIGAKLAVLN